MLLFLLACAADPNAPPEVAWDHVACDHCAMLLSEPAYGAVLVTRDGASRYFDDPGCVFRYMLDQKPSVSRIWFSSASGWLRDGEVAFTTGHHSPMGSGLQAVPVGTPGALSFGEASARVMAP